GGFHGAGTARERAADFIAHAGKAGVRGQGEQVRFLCGAAHCGWLEGDGCRGGAPWVRSVRAGQRSGNRGIRCARVHYNQRHGFGRRDYSLTLRHDSQRGAGPATRSQADCLPRAWSCKMNLRQCLSTIACLLAAIVAGPSAAATAPLRIMTFNVRVPVDQGMNAWANRRALMVQVIEAQHPDILGTQELTQGQGEYLAAHLPGYAWFGQGRDGGTKGEHMGVFYRTDRLKVLRSGDFWLSDTPTVPGSITWGQPYPRMVTWARFRLRDGGGTFEYFNTHFTYRPEDVRPRMLSANEILQRIGKLPPGV